MLEKLDTSAGVRLLGVHVSQLYENPSEQLRFDEPIENWRSADRAVQAIRERFGTEALGPTAVMLDGHRRVDLSSSQHWGPNDSGHEVLDKRDLTVDET